MNEELVGWLPDVPLELIGWMVGGLACWLDGRLMDGRQLIGLLPFIAPFHCLLSFIQHYVTNDHLSSYFTADDVLSLACYGKVYLNGDLLVSDSIANACVGVKQMKCPMLKGRE